MIDPDKLKEASRGYGRDMSPTAISHRLDLVVELNKTCKWLGKAQLIESEATTHVSKPKTDEPKPGKLLQEDTESTEMKQSVLDFSVSSCEKLN